MLEVTVHGEKPDLCITPVGVTNKGYGPVYKDKDALLFKSVATQLQLDKFQGVNLGTSREEEAG